MKKAISLLLAIAIISVQSGCSAIMAIKQPSKKNLGVLNAGTSRDNVITYLGPPASSEMENGKRVDVYQFKQGYSGGVKATRATVYVVLDALTLFIWELIGIPIELIANGHQMTVKVHYDANDKVEDFTYLEQPQ